jgi:uncharacterized membrane protein
MIHARLLDRLDSLRASYWFVPMVMAIGAVLLSAATLALDGALGSNLMGTLYTGEPEGARGVLAVIATSMITVAGVTFSIALASMALASAQFGPRLLRNFMRDHGNQIVLGTFLATFLFSLLVLLSVRGGDEGEAFVPTISMGVAVLLTLASTSVLIYFIHHAATLIQVAHIVASVTSDLERDIDRSFTETPTDARADVSPPQLPTGAGAAVIAQGTGYVEVVDTAALVGLMDKRDMVIRLVRHPGSFVVPGDLLAEVWPADGAHPGLHGTVRAAFILGSQRTEQEDVGFAIQQLVQIALRALSPAINDPFTAAMCVDRLGAVMTRVVGRPIPSPYRFCDGRLRAIVPVPSFEHLLGSAFTEIRRNARTQLGLSIRLLTTLAAIAAKASRAEDRAAVAAEAGLIIDGFVTESLLPAERSQLQAAHRECLRSCALEGGAS